MGKKIPTTTSFHLPDGREVVLETGKLATLCDGSVVVRMGKTMLLATAVSVKEAKAGQAFFPLSVDYQEKYGAVGRVPGNFFRRETRLNDYEVLVSRLVDRALRPLFPDGYMNETQVIISLISADKDDMPDALAGLAASAAIAVSDIPVEAMFSEVRVARINGQFVVNPTRKALEKADMDFIVAATLKDVTMVEGEADECQEHELVEAIKIGHDAIKVQIAAQQRLAELVGDKATKRAVAALPEHEELKARIKAIAADTIKAIASKTTNKDERRSELEAAKKACKEQLATEYDEAFFVEWGETLSRYFDKLKKDVIRHVVLDSGKRLDGRKVDEIRPIWTEVDYLPAAHGSAIFTRGETQSLTTLTLGTKQDVMLVDTAMDYHDEKFILHYNFPSFSTGEVKPARGPGRREIGHANLAARSLRKMLPKAGFEYTIRVVSDILESNGSSSMATVCAGSMAMMDGGVPLKAPVAGIAMGCIAEGSKIAVLSDILGDEDALGDMDFKLTGTSKGICGAQMDIKIDGMPYELLEKALGQARQGRLHILGCMEESITEPAPSLKEHAPRMVVLRIAAEYIGAVIGPGGKIIQEMQKSTGTVISIEEDELGGKVSIYGPDKAAIDAAMDRVNDITFTPEVGGEYDGVVETLQPYGAFLKFKGKSGLLHVSEISYKRIENVEDVLKVGDTIRVKLLDADPKTGKLRLSAKALLPKPDGYVEREDRGADRRGGGGGDRGGNDRGGDRRDGGGNRGGGGFRR